MAELRSLYSAECSVYLHAAQYALREIASHELQLIALNSILINLETTNAKGVKQSRLNVRPCSPEYLLKSSKLGLNDLIDSSILLHSIETTHEGR